MTSSLVTVTPETGISEARTLMHQRGIRHLLVMDGPRLLGHPHRPGHPSRANDRLGDRAEHEPAQPGPSMRCHRDQSSACPLALGEDLCRRVAQADVALDPDPLGDESLLEGPQGVQRSKRGQQVGEVFPGRTHQLIGNRRYHPQQHDLEIVRRSLR
jgi:hypothetical protein